MELMASVQASFQGPLPPPTFLEHYDRIVPGSAARILEVFQAQAEHRQRLENIAIGGGDRLQHRGQILAFVLASPVVLTGCWAVLTGKPLSGLCTLLVALGTPMGLLIYKRREQEKELKGKQPARSQLSARNP
jgi:uncharacterized membrane protein